MPAMKMVDLWQRAVSIDAEGELTQGTPLTLSGLGDGNWLASIPGYRPTNLSIRDKPGQRRQYRWCNPRRFHRSRHGYCNYRMGA